MTPMFTEDTNNIIRLVACVAILVAAFLIAVLTKPETK